MLTITTSLIIFLKGYQWEDRYSEVCAHNCISLQNGSSFNIQESWNVTTLSKHVWSLKENTLNYSIKWRMLERCKLYFYRTSSLCLLEKGTIITNFLHSDTNLNCKSKVFNHAQMKRKMWSYTGGKNHEYKHEKICLATVINFQRKEVITYEEINFTKKLFNSFKVRRKYDLCG